MIRMTIASLAAFGTLWLASCSLFPTPPPTRDQVEAMTSTFKPSYFTDEKVRHWAIPFDIVDGQLRISKRLVRERPGPVPFRRSSAGSLTVIYFDQYGQELGRYQIPDPTRGPTLHYEYQEAPEVPPLKPIDKIDILVPADDRIAEVVLDQTPNRFDLRWKLQQGIRKIERRR